MTVATKAKAKGRGKASAVPAVARPVPPSAERAMSLATVAATIEVSVRSLRQMVAAGEYPRPDLTVGKRPRWSVEVHNAWFAAQKGGRADAGRLQAQE